MPQTSKTPAGKAGASRDSFAGLSHSLSNFDAYGMQFPILALHCGPDWLVMFAAVGSGGLPG